MRSLMGHDVVKRFWEELMEDAEQLAAERRDEGWETLVLTPGDVTPVARDPPLRGLDVVVGGDEFETLQRWVEDDGIAFESSNVYRQERSDVVFVLLTLLNEPTGTAVFCPLYYHRQVAEEMLRAVEEAGTIFVSVRSLSPDETVSFEHDEPALFVPDGASESE
jgi:hypothetical protein